MISGATPSSTPVPASIEWGILACQSDRSLGPPRANFTPGRTTVKPQHWCQMSELPATDRDRPVPYTAVFSTRLGWVALAWRDGLLCGLVFGHESRREAQAALQRQLHHNDSNGDARDMTQVARLIDELCRFAAGEPVDFAHVMIDTGHLTPLARRVTAACRRIRWGEVRTYGQLAATCGSPGAARAVGQVMATNRFPLIVPCHRVLAAGGHLGGYSAPQGLKMKRRLLAMEHGHVSACPRCAPLTVQPNIVSSSRR
jgi:methylated-DNA-[protein]-cysteine S-methyltransferase